MTCLTPKRKVRKRQRIYALPLLFLLDPGTYYYLNSNNNVAIIFLKVHEINVLHEIHVLHAINAIHVIHAIHALHALH